MGRYSATLKGGIGGGLAGLAVGFLGVYGAAKRYPAFGSLTLPLKAFLVTSSGTFAGELPLVPIRTRPTYMLDLKPYIWRELQVMGRERSIRLSFRHLALMKH